MQQEAANSEQNAKDLQHKISSARKKITKLKAREILPYTLLVMLVGSAIYILGLLIF